MSSVYWKTVCLGVIAGMRSMGAPALVSDSLARKHPLPLEDSPLRWLGTAKSAKVFKFLAVGEIVGDKLPTTPSRIAPGPLFGRIMAGGLSGAGLYTAESERPAIGAAVGAVAAIAGAYGFYHLRQELGKRLPVPDPVIGVLEDILAYGTGWLVLRSE